MCYQAKLTLYSAVALGIPTRKSSLEISLFIVPCNSMMKDGGDISQMKQIALYISIVNTHTQTYICTVLCKSFRQV